MDNHELVIIGLGISGIALAKEASKNDINYLVLEKNDSFGGVWFNSPKYSCLQTHKNYYGYCDFKFPDYFNNYPSKQEILKYLENIINQFKILEKTVFNYDVRNIIYDKNNKTWIIDNRYKCKYLGICSGYLASPNKELCDKQLKNFTGNIYHTKDFNKININKLNNKNLLIVGNGASSCDVLNNLDKNKIKCNTTLVYKSDKYFIGKYIKKTVISNFLSKSLLIFGKYSPLFIYRLIIICINLFCFKNYLQIPKTKMNSKNLIANLIICEKIANNTLVYLKDKIIDSSDNSIILKDNIILNVDTIILATGYSEKFVFFKEQPDKEKYLQIFDSKFENCGFIGFSPSYNWSKVSEKQSKIFIDYILGNFVINESDINDYKEKHRTNQEYNNLPFNDLTYELFNY